MLEGHDPEVLAAMGASTLRPAAVLLAKAWGEPVEDVVARAFELVSVEEAGAAAMEALEERLGTVMAATSQVLLARSEAPPEGWKTAAAGPVANWIAEHPDEVRAAMLFGVGRLLASRLDRGA